MDVIEKSLTAPTWDFVWSGGAEEGREKQLAQHPFLNDLSEIPIAADHSVEELYVADAAVKVRVLFSCMRDQCSSMILTDGDGVSERHLRPAGSIPSPRIGRGGTCPGCDQEPPGARRSVQDCPRPAKVKAWQSPEDIREACSFGRY